MSLDVQCLFADHDGIGQAIFNVAEGTLNGGTSVNPLAERRLGGASSHAAPWGNR